MEGVWQHRKDSQVQIEGVDTYVKMDQTSLLCMFPSNIRSDCGMTESRVAILLILLGFERAGMGVQVNARVARTGLSFWKVVL